MNIAKIIEISRKYLSPFIFSLFVLFIWNLIFTNKIVSARLLPSPFAVGYEAIANFSVLIYASLVTLTEALGGLLIGIFVAIILSVIILKNKTFEQSVTPFLVGSQMVPILAIAPLIMIWFGTGYLAKLIVVGYLTFFPVTLALLKSYKSVSIEKIQLIETYQDSFSKKIIYVYFPSSLPTLFSVVKVTAPMSLVGAILAELPLGSGDGLGIILLNTQRYSLVSYLGAAVIFSTISGLVLYLLVNLLERKVVVWRKA